MSTLCGFWCCRFSLNVSTRQPIPASTDDCSEVTAHLSSLVKKPCPPPLDHCTRAWNQLLSYTHTHTHRLRSLKGLDWSKQYARKKRHTHMHACTNKHTHAYTSCLFSSFHLPSQAYGVNCIKSDALFLFSRGRARMSLMWKSEK